MTRAALAALSLVLAACGVRGPPRPPHAAEGTADAGAGRQPGPSCLDAGCPPAPCAEGDGGCSR